jgi:hypothetical protein
MVMIAGPPALTSGGAVPPTVPLRPLFQQECHPRSTTLNSTVELALWGRPLRNDRRIRTALSLHRVTPVAGQRPPKRRAQPAVTNIAEIRKGAISILTRLWILRAER